MDAESLDGAWDPAAPGAGALRATAIAQLYFRMTSHHPLTILVVDALCLTFGADGVTVQELVDYLGITEDRIRFGLEGIPAEMRCTDRQLESEGLTLNVADAPGDYNRSAKNNTMVSGSRSEPSGDRRGEKEVRYFLNYKRLLPLVYAHGIRLLLSACVVNVPPCSYVEAVKAAQLAPYSRSSDSTAHAFFANTQPTGATARPSTGATTGPEGRPPAASAVTGIFVPLPYAVAEGANEHIDVSDAMKRKSAIRGVYCFGCSCYFLVQEFNDTLSRCPRCGKDALRLCIQSIQRQLNARVAEQHTVVKLLPSVSQIWKKSVATMHASSKRRRATEAEELSTTTMAGASTNNAPAPAKVSAVTTSASQSLNCALASDPFLFQQALAFLYLYTSRFASVNDAASVVDAQQILTEPEYRERLRGKASLADQFRSRHRHATSVHVRLISQDEVDAARRKESHQKLLKRAMLPPWLRHISALEALGGHHVCAYKKANNGEKRVEEKTTEEGYGPVGPDAQELWKSEEVKTCDHVRLQHPQSSTVAKTEKGSSTAAVGDKRPRLITGVKTGAELTRTADFIAKHYYEDEYDEVALPLSLTRRRRS